VAGLLTDKCIDPAIKDGGRPRLPYDLPARSLHGCQPRAAWEVLACSQGYCDQTTVAVLPLILPCAHPSCG